MSTRLDTLNEVLAWMDEIGMHDCCYYSTDDLYAKIREEVGHEAARG